MRDRGRGRGGVALAAVLALPLLAGFAALVVDLGRLMVSRTELQNAMDACALAAAAALNGSDDPTIFDMARAHALALIDPARSGAEPRPAASVNRVEFQRHTLRADSLRVEFSKALNGQPWVAATGAQTLGLSPREARVARCSYQHAGVRLWLLPLLAVLGPAVPAEAAVSASAAATLAPGQTACVLPLAVCAVPGSTAATRYGHDLGERLVAVKDPRSGYGTGNFGWLDFTPPGGGTPELRGLIDGSGTCAVGTGQAVGSPGVVSALETSWNARFGLYAGSTRPQDAPPDFTGYAYPSGSGHYADFVARARDRAPFQGSAPGNHQVLSRSEHAEYGQRRRVVTAAVVDCSQWTSGSANPVILDFACVLLLAPVASGGGKQWSQVSETMDLEFLGLTRDPGTPCATLGLAGGSFGPPVPTLVQ